MLRSDRPNPFRRPLTLRDWRFCYCLPVTPPEYEASVAHGGFALVGGYRNWGEYEMARDRVKAMLDAFAAAGLQMEWGPPAWVFCSLLRGQQAVILLTHAEKAMAARDGALEFRGQMTPFQLIVSRVNPAFSGILDICACEADAIQAPLKQRAPGCGTKVADRKLSLDFWVAYYAEFLKLFFEAPTTYYDAIMRVRALI